MGMAQRHRITSTEQICACVRVIFSSFFLRTEQAQAAAGMDQAIRKNVWVSINVNAYRKYPDRNVSLLEGFKTKPFLQHMNNKVVRRENLNSLLNEHRS